MSLLSTLMEYYPYVFHPAITIGAGALVLIHHEWTRQGADRSTLYRRVGGFLGAGVLSLVPSLAYMLVTGQGPMETMSGNAWQVDALVAGGIGVAAAVTWLLWWRYDWGSLVPTYMQTLIVVTVPYIALSPVWNFSGHVTMSLMPVLFLVLVDRKFWPLLLVPLVMVPNRIYVDAHTWAQAIGAFVITGALVVGVYWYRNDGSLRPASAESTPLGPQGGRPAGQGRRNQ